MSSKVIFWIDRTFVEFGVAKYLQDVTEHEFFTIFDVTDKAKEFFQSQKFLNRRLGLS